MTRTSVIIPAYNQAHYLGQAIQSVLDQTDPDFELVLVDDGSTDETAQVAQRFSDPRLTYVFQFNRGLSGARNTGLRRASGTYVTFLDADDLFLPDKLSLLAAELDRHPEAGLAAGQAHLIDEAGCLTEHRFESRLPADVALLLLGNPLHVGSVMLRRTWQQRAGEFDERLRSYEDWDMWLRLARLGCPMVCLAQPVSLYRFHAQQMTRIGEQMTTATFAVLDKLYADPALPERWQQLRALAYSRAHLRAAAQCYLGGDYAQGQDHLQTATRLEPELLAQGAQTLAEHFSAWTELPKIKEPLAFLEAVYLHLPEQFGALRRRRRRELGRAAMGLAFRAFHQGRTEQARRALWKALRYQPAWLANRGALAMLLKTWPSRTDLVGRNA